MQLNLLLILSPNKSCTFCIDSIDNNFSVFLASLGHRNVVITLLLIGWTNAILPSFQSFSVMPYGNIAYTLSVRLSVLVNPLACMIVLFKRTKSGVVLVTLTGIGTIFTIYHVVFVAYSPYPPVYDEPVGAAISVIFKLLLNTLM